MNRREGNWMSLDSDTAMRGVRYYMSREELTEVAYHARYGAARRVALVRLNEQSLMCIFAFSDRDPMVRRGMARYINDKDTLNRMKDQDEDMSVREAAVWRLSKLNDSK